ncbi:protein of unknown function [Shinella sp. WSC3-e]|nr:hypothetical protein SHINE37_41744 [Rhizobiaceae bacterium]CAK7256362.1 protein of unknown function [Shinella sp. WSC3-e]
MAPIRPLYAPDDECLISKPPGNDCRAALFSFLLPAATLAVGTLRALLEAIRALGEIRTLLSLNFALFGPCGLVEATGAFFALLGRCVLNCHSASSCGAEETGCGTMRFRSTGTSLKAVTFGLK